MTPWLTLIGRHAPAVPMLEVELTYSAAELVAAKAKVGRDSAAKPSWAVRGLLSPCTLQRLVLKSRMVLLVSLVTQFIGSWCQLSPRSASASQQPSQSVGTMCCAGSWRQQRSASA